MEQNAVATGTGSPLQLRVITTVEKLSEHLNTGSSVEWNVSSGLFSIG